ncbi:MAG TPA: hypothetical protein VH561_18390 [Micromonosporaceae bacterium]|jgi:hypothetical protein
MLPPSLFAPLDLHAAVEEARRTQGAHGVVDLLVVTLTDRRVRSDADIDEHLDTLKAACRQTRRYREAIPVLERIATLNPERRHEVAAELAVVHSHLGETRAAVSLLESAVGEQHALPPSRRSLAFSLTAEVAAVLLRETALAQRCADLGRTAVAAPPTRAKRRATPARTLHGAPPARAEQTAPAGAERTGAPRRRSGLARPVLAAEPALIDIGGDDRTQTPMTDARSPRRRTGLARPVLSAEPPFADLDPEQAVSTRPILTLITGSAA